MSPCEGWRQILAEVPSFQKLGRQIRSLFPIPRKLFAAERRKQAARNAEFRRLKLSSHNIPKSTRNCRCRPALTGCHSLSFGAFQPGGEALTSGNAAISAPRRRTALYSLRPWDTHRYPSVPGTSEVFARVALDCKPPYRGSPAVTHLKTLPRRFDRGGPAVGSRRR